MSTIHTTRSDQNPYWFGKSRHQYQWSFSVSCGVHDSKIIGPLFFNNTLTGRRYVSEILKGPVEDFRCDMPLARLGAMWHDGAPAHCSSEARAWLDLNFPGQWIGRNGPVQWPARSPDLNSSDFSCGTTLRIADTTRKRRPQKTYRRG